MVVGGISISLQPCSDKHQQVDKQVITRYTGFSQTSYVERRLFQHNCLNKTLNVVF